MKNILYLLSLALILVGCEKYELTSDPQLNLNGWWDVVDINVVIDEVNYDSEIEVLSEDQASVSAFVVTGQDSSGNLLLTQNFKVPISKDDSILIILNGSLITVVSELQIV